MPDTEIPRDRWASRTYPPAIDRILARCEEHDGCWVYQGPTDRKGYVRLRENGGGKVFGHRATYEFFIGAIPDGMTFDHLCENTSCVNPWHGDLVPSLVNIRRASRGMAATNRNKTACPKGHPLTGDNLVPSAPGRICRECRKETNRRYRARRAGKAVTA